MLATHARELEASFFQLQGLTMKKEDERQDPSFSVLIFLDRAHVRSAMSIPAKQL